MHDTGREFLDLSRRYLTTEYLPKIRACVERLDEGQLWWRPNEASNSVGNLVLHLAGNLGQWVVSAVGGAPDARERQREFDARDPLPGAALLERLGAVVAAADAVLARLDPARLAERRVVQGREVSVLHAVYHAVEHFGMHTGQIAYLAKQQLGADLGFYEVRDGVPRARWEGRARDLD